MLGSVACGGEPQNKPVSATSEWNEVELKHAEMFGVQERGDERLVYLYEGQGQDRDTISVLHLVSKGGKVPLIDGTVRIEVPVSRSVTTSTTHVPFFQILGELDRLVGCAFLSHVMEPEVRALVDSGALVEISDGQRIDQERLLMTAPDVVLAYPFGQAMENIHLDASIPRIGVTEYLEPHPLGRTEWIRFFGMLVEREEEAVEIFDDIRARYDSIRMEQMLRSFKPGVFFGSYWQGQWHASGGDSYMANLIRDSGGNYLFSDKQTSKNISVDIEELVVRGQQAHVFGKILHQEPPVLYKDLIGVDTRLSDLVKTRGMIVFYGNTATADLFGTALVEPDVLLAEMSAVLDGREEEGQRYFRVAK